MSESGDLEALAAPWADRRSEAKARVYNGLSILVRDGAMEQFYEFGELVGLGEDAIEALLDEVSEELARRSVRLTRLNVPEVLDGG